MKLIGNVAVICMVMVLVCSAARAETIGSVSTVFKVLGANDKIVVEAFDDPDIEGVTCYLSRAKKGGISGSLGVAEDTSDASLSCRQVGPISVPERIRNKKEDGEEVFKKRTSLLFKSMQVVRFYDAKRNVIIYLTYSDRIIEGSPKNSISCVPVMPWGN
ncbi:protein CreA [Desulfovibrio subterraneus]|uniref:Protein CreA n=2 Tax=Desulfovibrio subterraneus TaxID=2718620 RepID=A0A7J0BI20_9BACT|nr:protein CreA [Desulfovibrio subterraneus]GFM33349.1 protein CreA [Desulfovibrio subterraneus]